jgi:uncharacterized protein (TIGR00369 family)
MTGSPEQSITLAELGARMSDSTPQAVALGIRLVTVEPGLAVMAVPHDDKLVGDPESGVIAGGVVTTLLDHVCGLAVTSKLLERGTLGPVATLDLRIDYMRAAEPGLEIVARAHCYKLGHTIAFVRATAFDVSEDDPIATAQAAFAMSARGAAE